AGREAWVQWDKSAIRGDFLFELAPDSAVRVDVGQKRAEWLNVYKLLRRDPRINGEQLLRTGLELHGMDPTKLLVPPQPPAPPPPTIRYSFSGADLTNPIVVAIVQKHSPAPISPDDLKAALALMDA